MKKEQIKKINRAKLPKISEADRKYSKSLTKSVFESEFENQEETMNSTEELLKYLKSEKNKKK